jgi:hypothetical protein
MGSIVFSLTLAAGFLKCGNAHRFLFWLKKETRNELTALRS